MDKRRRTDNTMDKRRSTDNTMTNIVLSVLLL
jgi:hypothetical protein